MENDSDKDKEKEKENEKEKDNEKEKENVGEGECASCAPESVRGVRLWRPGPVGDSVEFIDVGLHIHMHSQLHTHKGKHLHSKFSCIFSLFCQLANSFCQLAKLTLPAGKLILPAGKIHFASPNSFQSLTHVQALPYNMMSISMSTHCVFFVHKSVQSNLKHF